jgi:hypothetical protein
MAHALRGRLGHGGLHDLAEQIAGVEHAYPLPFP